MKDLKLVIAKNIARLRVEANMTQIDLAGKLNYSDKAVSKWERGESLPDISVLVQIAEIFSVTLDTLVHSDADEIITEMQEPKQKKTKNHVIITVISMLAVLFVATWAFSLTDMLPFEVTLHWFAFVYAVPVAMVVWLIFNSIWFNKQRNYLIISLLMWTLLLSVYLTLLVLGNSFWQLFIVGIPAQAIIIAWSNISYKDKYKDNPIDWITKPGKKEGQIIVNDLMCYKWALYYSEWFYDVDPILIMAIIKTESDFVVNAVSSSGAYGLMQIMPATYNVDIKSSLGLEEDFEYLLEDPEFAIKCGSYYLHWLYAPSRGLNNSVVNIAAAYNGGCNEVKKWLGTEGLAQNGELIIEKIPKDETRRYVQKVLANYEYFAELYS